jgi:hypothetical protein
VNYVWQLEGDIGELCLAAYTVCIALLGKTLAHCHMSIFSQAVKQQIYIYIYLKLGQGLGEKWPNHQPPYTNPEVTSIHGFQGLQNDENVIALIFSWCQFEQYEKVRNYYNISYFKMKTYVSTD